MEKISLDCKGIVRWFGGVRDLTSQLAAAGHPTPYRTVEKWRYRTSLPLERVLQLERVALAQGRTFNVHDFVKTRT